jgi:hypothetical protein
VVASLQFLKVVCYDLTEYVFPILIGWPKDNRINKGNDVLLDLFFTFFFSHNLILRSLVKFKVYDYTQIDYPISSLWCGLVKLGDCGISAIPTFLLIGPSLCGVFISKIVHNFSTLSQAVRPWLCPWWRAAYASWRPTLLGLWPVGLGCLPPTHSRGKMMGGASVRPWRLLRSFVVLSYS